MNHIPKDVIHVISLNLMDPRDVYRFGISCKHVADCLLLGEDSEVFWKNLSVKHYPFALKEDGDSWKIHYVSNSFGGLNFEPLRPPEKGFFSRIFNRTRFMRIAVCGISGSGKSTCIHKLKTGEILKDARGKQRGCVQYKNVDFGLIECPSLESVMTQAAWDVVDGLILLVDSDDRDSENISQLNEFVAWFNNMLKKKEKGVGILIMCNKQDKVHAMSVAEMVDKMRLHSLRHAKWFVQACCCTSGDGLYEGLDWLHNVYVGKY